MSKIPTAEEFIHICLSKNDDMSTSEMLIEFARLHICDCKVQILEELPDTLSTEVYDTIRNTYPLDNIK